MTERRLGLLLRRSDEVEIAALFVVLSSSQIPSLYVLLFLLSSWLLLMLLLLLRRRRRLRLQLQLLLLLVLLAVVSCDVGGFHVCSCVAVCLGAYDSAWLLRHMLLRFFE